LEDALELATAQGNDLQRQLDQHRVAAGLVQLEARREVEAMEERNR
jgi:hypothetical protein